LQYITDASVELNLSQSGISYAIKSFERDLNVQLLIRKRIGVALTPEGNEIHNHIKEVLQANQRLIEEANALNKLITGTVRVGTFTTVTTHWMPKILKFFKENYPDINIKLVEGDYQSLEDGVYKGDLDCCFTVQSEKKLIPFTPLKSDILYCIVSNEFGLNNYDKITIDQIKQYPLIKPTKGWDYEIMNYFRKNNIKPSIAYEVSDDQSIIALVQAGLGINIRPGLVLTDKPQNITILNLENEAHRTIGIGTAKYSSHATNKFIEVVKWFKENGKFDYNF